MQNHTLLTITSLIGTVFIMEAQRRLSGDTLDAIPEPSHCCWVQAIPSTGGVACIAPPLHQGHDPLSEYQKRALGIPVNLNHATPEDLQRIPGIGRKRAQKIVRFRKEKGDFRTLEQLIEVPGIGPKRWATLSPYLTVSSTTCSKRTRE